VAPEILGAFCERYPGIDLALKVTNRDRVMERLAGNEDDVYIVGQVDEHGSELEILPFVPNPLVLVARSDHPLAGDRDIPVARLAEEYFLLREPGSGVRDATIKHLAKGGVKPRVRMQLGSNEAIKHSIVGGLGISVLSLHSLVLESSGGQLTLLDVQGFPIERTWYLVYSRTRELSLVAKTFIDFALEHGAEIRTRLDAVQEALTHKRDA
jgi:DNA-binding transcriptional LysR family regulator